MSRGRLGGGRRGRLSVYRHGGGQTDGGVPGVGEHGRVLLMQSVQRGRGQSAGGGHHQPRPARAQP